MSSEVLATCKPPLQVQVPPGPPADWRQATLGDIITLEYGRSLPDKLRRVGDVAVYGSNGVVGAHDEALVPTSGIVVGRKGTAGSVTVSPGPFWPIDTTYFVKARQAVDWDWLAASLHHVRLHELNEATGVPGLNRDKAYRQPVLLPPLDEQRRIAEVLRSVDEAIAANWAALDQVARARSAILHTAFEEPLWEVVPLGELGSWQSGGTPSKDDDTKWGGDVPWVCPRDMKTPVIRRTHSSLTPLALGGSCKLVPKGTLMVVVRGMILAKAIPTATTAMDATFNQDMKAFRPNGRALPKFVQLCLQHQERQLLRVVNTATHGTKKLDTDTLLAVSVPLPNLETQQALADAVSDLDFASVKYGEEHIRLSTMKRALMSDLLSGRIRVPAVSGASPTNVQPAFKRAVFAAEVVYQLHNDSRFGSVKHEKIVHLCELHIGLQRDLDRHAYKKAAGPYDPAARRSVENIFRQQKWFNAAKPDGKRVVYVPLKKIGDHRTYYDRYFGAHKPAIQSIIDLLRPLDTERCEMIATAYSVWNDFLLDDHQPSDAEIVAAILKWHPAKTRIPEARWNAVLPWMRQHDLVPKGIGEKTRGGTE